MEVDTIEGQVTELSDEPERALVVSRPQAPIQAHLLSGLGAVALMPDDEFDRSLALMRKGVDRARKMQETILDDGVDFGALPGVKRPFLHKPGAEKLEKAYGLATSYVIQRIVGTGPLAPGDERIETPDLSFIVRSRVHLGTTDGPVVAEGVGEANTFEKKYRYRKGERECPNCGKPAIRGPSERRGGGGQEFFCWRKLDGCGSTFGEGTPEYQAIASTQADIENPDPHDLANTVLKIAKKRAYVDGILQATATSGLFTQDEDTPGVADRPTGSQDGPGRPQGNRAAPRGTRGGNDAPAASDGLHRGKVERAEFRAQAKSQRWEGAQPKLEVVFKIGSRRHTAIIHGDLAEAANGLDIMPDELVQLDGTVEEIEWDPDKPKKKEIWGVTRIEVQRNGEWVGPPSLSLSTSSSTEPSPTSSPASESPSSSPTEGAPTDASTSESSGSSSSVEWHVGTDGEWEPLRLRLTTVWRINDTGPYPVAVGAAASLDTGGYIRIVFPDQSGEETGRIDAELRKGTAWRFAVDDAFSVYGYWRGGWFVIDTIADSV